MVEMINYGQIINGLRDDRDYYENSGLELSIEAALYKRFSDVWKKSPDYATFLLEVGKDDPNTKDVNESIPKEKVDKILTQIFGKPLDKVTIEDRAKFPSLVMKQIRKFIGSQYLFYSEADAIRDQIAFYTNLQQQQTNGI